MNANDRRRAILEVLCERREDTINNLAFEIEVSIRTMKYDIETLSLSHPIYTVQGKGGGVYIAKGYRFGRKYLKEKQEELLRKKLGELSGEERAIMQSILNEFSAPAEIKKRR